MLQTKNRTISVSRLTTTGEQRDFVALITGLQVYINQSSEELGGGYEGDPAFYAHKMLTE